MKKSFSHLAIFFCLLVLVTGCASHQNVEVPSSANQETSEEEQARMQRLDSASQVQQSGNIPVNTLSNPPKKVKKKVIND